MPSISLIIPVYNEGKNIPLLYGEIREAVENWDEELEILFIDDHSSDNTPNVIADIVKNDSRVRGFRLLRNTKKSGALELGFLEAQGDIIVTLDGDMQDDPHEMPKILQAIHDGADVVIGWRQQRADTMGKLLPSAVINRLTDWVLGQQLHDMNSGFKAFRRDTVQCMSFQGSLFRFLPHLLQIEGFDVREVPVLHRGRMHGKSKFSLRHRLRSLFDLGTVFFLAKYGDRPMHFFGTIGLLIFAAGVGCSAYLSVLWWQGMGVGHRPLLMLAILLLIIGVQVVSIGFIGELLLYLRQSHGSSIPRKTL
ncbi:MAG: glycosyltransferase family 2 protein [Candidatus Peribacteraceae bacterium]|nr:glycosyltransferase family 2 protein [Candidatus Peribacteraceae bacterium]